MDYLPVGMLVMNYIDVERSIFIVVGAYTGQGTCIKWRKLDKHKFAIMSLLSYGYRETSYSKLQVFSPFHHDVLQFWTEGQNKIFLS